MEVRRVVIPKQDVVYVRGILEASDGVAFVYSLEGGDLTIVASRSRSRELDEVLADLRAEVGDAWQQEPTRPSDVSK
jgi:hypothetical protein